MASLLLYGCWRSSASHRLQIGLRLKQLPFRYQPVNLDRREQHSRWYRDLNPRCELPTLVVDGEPWVQSLAILEALEESFPDSGLSLLPGDRRQRRLCRELAEQVNSSLQPLLLPARLRQPTLAAAVEQQAPAVQAALQKGVIACQIAALQALHDWLAPLPGPFCLGEQPTMADVLVVPHLEAAMRLGIDLNPYRRLSDLHSHCLRLEAFQAAAPERQCDAPGQATAPAAAEGVAMATERQTLLAHKDPIPALAAYLSQTANIPIPGLESCRRRTLQAFPVVASKMTALDGCLLLRWLCHSRRVRRVLEVGVFTGSSSLALLDGLPAEGSLVALDVEPRFTALAEACWQEVGRRHQVQLLHGDARALMAELQPGFDLIYLDADNNHYSTYLELALPLLAPGGLLVFDNVLWRGRVVEPGRDPSALALDHFNRLVRQRPDLAVTVLSLSDGLALVEPVEQTAS